MTVTLHRSAATWAAGAGVIDLAIHHALAAGDREDAAQLWRRMASARSSRATS